MTVYLINLALILFWRLFFAKRNCLNARKCYCGIVALQWILISGLRDWSVGADTYSYCNMFESAKTVTWRKAFADLSGYIFRNADIKDPGYTVLTKVFQIFSGSYQVFLLTIAVFFMTTMAIWICSNSASPCTSFVLFSTLFYSFYAITGHRQTIATALVVFLGYEQIRRRNFWCFAAVAFVGFLLHKSSMVFTVLYVLCRVPVTLGYQLLCAAGIVSVAVLGKDLYGPIARWLGYSETAINYTEGGAELYAVLLVMVCIVVWMLYPRIRQHRQDAEVLFHVNSLTLATGLLVIRNQSFMRIQQYFSLFLMITIPEVINTVRREHRLPVYLLFGAVMILYLMGNDPQYRFFFQQG